MNTLGRLFLLLVLVGGALTLSAQSHPNFTGTWKLNAEKSEMGSAGVTAMTVEVEHNEPVFKYTARGTAGGQDFEQTETFTTDDKPSKNAEGATVKAHWDGAALVAEATGYDGSMVYIARMMLSDDGKTITRVLTQADDPKPRHEFYEKQ
jgi:hypothetical protein